MRFDRLKRCRKGSSTRHSDTKNKPNILNVIAMEKFCSFRHVAMLIISHASWAYDKRCVACANISSICMFMELNGIGWNCNDIFIRFNLFVYQKNDIVELAGWRTMCVSWQVDLINQSINMALTKKKKSKAHKAYNRRWGRVITVISMNKLIESSDMFQLSHLLINFDCYLDGRDVLIDNCNLFPVCTAARVYIRHYRKLIVASDECPFEW